LQSYLENRRRYILIKIDPKEYFLFEIFLDCLILHIINLYDWTHRQVKASYDYFRSYHYRRAFDLVAFYPPFRCPTKTVWFLIFKFDARGLRKTDFIFIASGIIFLMKESTYNS
jgi:hypothetical protein